MNIKVGILGEPDGWNVLLQQIGIPCAEVTDTMLPDEFSVVVASDDVNDRESEMLRQYLTLGGAVLCSAKVYTRIRRTTAQLVNIDFLYPAHNSAFHSIGIIDISARCQLAWNANDLKTNRGALAAHVGVHLKGYIIALPFNPAAMIFDRRTAVKSFYSQEHRLPFETVSQVSKREIRVLVSHSLEILHHRRGLPYVHLWNFPNGARSIFCFRIDTDYGTEEQMRRLFLTVHRNGLPATWFVDTKSHEKSMKLYSEMYGQEIGVHCYEHQTFPDYERNINNIRKAQAVLRSAGLTAKGFVSPFGKWNDELGRAIVDGGFEYSSEFSYDYDNLPSTPRLQQGKAALQLPIHPICIGSLKRHRYDEEQMIRYFTGVIKRKLAVREPIILYHHPRDEHHAVLNWLFQEMRRERIPAKTMSEYAQWWKMRTTSVPEFQYLKGSMHVRGDRLDKSIYLRISQPDGTETVIPTSKQIVFETVRWASQPAAWVMPDDYLRIRRFNYRIPLVRGLDTVMHLIRRKQV